jgi:hypothetical protein
MSIVSKEAAIALAACVAAVLIPVMVFMLLHFPPRLNQDEKTMVSFTPAPVSLNARSWKEVTLSCPVTAAILTSGTAVATAVGPVPSGSILPDREPQLSFILYSGTARDIAILDGHLLHAGQHIRGTRLVNIEQTRVQIEDRKGKRWLTLE